MGLQLLWLTLAMDPGGTESWAPLRPEMLRHWVVVWLGKRAVHRTPSPTSSCGPHLTQDRPSGSKEGGQVEEERVGWGGKRKGENGKKKGREEKVKEQREGKDGGKE